MACSSFAAEEKSVPEAEGGSAGRSQQGQGQEPLQAAGKSRQTHGEPHSHKSWIMAAMLPRRSPITR